MEEDKFCLNCGKENVTNANYCGHCGSPTDTNTKKCVHCGSLLNIKDNYCLKCGRTSIPEQLEYVQQVTIVPKHIRDSLNQYTNKCKNATCSECGYFGDMGIVNTSTPWLSWWGFVCYFLASSFLLLFFPFIGAVAVLLLIIVFFVDSDIRIDLNCPNCNAFFSLGSGSKAQPNDKPKENYFISEFKKMSKDLRYASVAIFLWLGYEAVTAIIRAISG